METITTNKKKPIEFFEIYKNHLQKKVLELDDTYFNKFIRKI